MANYIFKVYQDKAGRWRWNATAKLGGKIIGASSQGFASKQSAERNASLNGFPKV